MWRCVDGVGARAQRPQVKQRGSGTSATHCDSLRSCGILRRAGLMVGELDGRVDGRMWGGLGRFGVEMAVERVDGEWRG